METPHEFKLIAFPRDAGSRRPRRRPVPQTPARSGRRAATGEAGHAMPAEEATYIAPASPTPIGMGQIIRLLNVLVALDKTIALAVRRELVIPKCLDRRQS